MHQLLPALFIGALLALSGCSSAHLKSAGDGGDLTLDAREIFDLIAGNTLHLIAYDFEAAVFFDEDGSLAAIDPEEQRDGGSWDITDDNRLCLKFRLWYYGDASCYTLMPADNGRRWTFHTPNGTAYYSAALQPGDPAGLRLKVERPRSGRFLREQLAAERDADTGRNAATAEPGQTEAAIATAAPAAGTAAPGADNGLARLARNCPGCNLAGARLKDLDLAQANLEGANLEGADLRYTNLRRARLAGANLSGARLNHANLPGADLTGADLSGADLSGANLLLADLTGADLTGAHLATAHIENTKGLESKP